MYTCIPTAVGDTNDRNGLAIRTADADEQCGGMILEGQSIPNPWTFMGRTASVFLLA